jgi:hypothetical protein
MVAEFAPPPVAAVFAVNVQFTSEPPFAPPPDAEAVLVIKKQLIKLQEFAPPPEPDEFPIKVQLVSVPE